MANLYQDLTYHTDEMDFDGIRMMVGATEIEMLSAYNRAIKRTAKTMQSLSRKFLKNEMDAKNEKVIRRRMQSYQTPFKLKSNKSLTELTLWFGLNDMSVGKLKGSSKRLGTKRNPKGAMFTSKKLGKHDFPDSFVARMRQQKSIFSRKGVNRFPVKEAQIPVDDAIHTKLEDDIFELLPEIFMQHFKTDIKGRVAGRGQIAKSSSKWS